MKTHKLVLATIIVSSVLVYCSAIANDFLDFGILHSIARYSEWHAKEEQIVTLLTAKRKMLLSERHLVKAYQCKNHIIYKPKLNGMIISQRKRKIHSGTKFSLLKRSWRGVLIKSRIKRLLILDAIYRDTQAAIHVILQLSDLNAQKVYYKEIGYENDDSTFTWTKLDKWIGFQDMFFTSIVWLHFREVHLTSPHNLSHGLEFETKAGGMLTTDQKAAIGVFALLQQRYFMSVEWLGLAISSSEISDATVFRNLLDMSVQEHNKIGYQNMWNNNDMSEAVYDTALNLFNSPITPSAIAEEMLPQRQIYFDEFKGFGSNGLDANFMSLCQGNSFLSFSQQINLKCRYESRSNHYLFINPLKMEQLSESPPIYQFYDVLGNTTIETLKSQMGKYVKTGVGIGNSETDIRDVRGTRAAVGLDPMTTPLQVYTASEMITGLKLLICPFHDQYAEYSYGRMYRIHTDHFKPSYMIEEMEDYELNGNRLATLLYYLEVADSGGYTPFMSAGVYAHPVRNSAVFWYNMFRNGSLRYNVDHAGCPVIHGNKIVMAHFFRYNSNWSKYKCTLSNLE